MRCCSQCGGALRRIHRSFWERFAYLAIYECRDCKEINCVQRPYRHHFGEWCRCPHCGTVRVTRLASRDKIDPMYSGLVNLVKKLVGGHLHHCKFCRVQFYDRRKLAPAHQVTPPASKYATAQEE